MMLDSAAADEPESKKKRTHVHMLQRTKAKTCLWPEAKKSSTEKKLHWMEGHTRAPPDACHSWAPWDPMPTAA